VNTPAAYRRRASDTQCAEPARTASVRFSDGTPAYRSAARRRTYLREALSNNGDVKIAAARVLQAEAALSAARSQFFPTDQRPVRIGHHPHFRTGPTTVPPTVNPQRDYGDVFAAMPSYEVDLWGQNPPRQRAAKARPRHRHALEAQQTVRQTLIASVATRLSRSAGLDYELEIAQRTYGGPDQSWP